MLTFNLPIILDISKLVDKCEEFEKSHNYKPFIFVNGETLNLLTLTIDITEFKKMPTFNESYRQICTLQGCKVFRDDDLHFNEIVLR